ncbi:M23 family metallopeptidase [Actinomadura macrotermitis]|uniref:Peptidase family M23 n=1 Tax=Actinomadura macrotermitis TaxID=2585200 RepID=A0A7K0BMS0_9ACTN|nr:M23 family metallopeptidase [Actinomadura macrotermitis]MQY02477.1 hypothetical protein [Actinomadura macrotermitis]
MARSDTTHDAFWAKPSTRPRKAARRQPERRRPRRLGDGPSRTRRPPAPDAARPRARRSRARPRRSSGAVDRLSTGAFVLSVVIGLALLAVVERDLLDGGTIGATGPAGARRGLAAQPRRKTAAPERGRPHRAVPAPARTPAPAAPDLRALTGEVRTLTVDERGPAARQDYGAASDRPPLVEIDRTSGDRAWAFGTTAVPVPATRTAAPQTAFFAARWTPGRWRIALSGTPAFGALTARMPVSVMSPGEAAALRRFSAVTAAQAAAALDGRAPGDGLMLPWATGAAWSLDTPSSGRPLGVLAFSGGDGRVRAAGDGRLYRFCGGGLVMVVHGSGVATTYDGLRDVSPLRGGSVVRRGDVLGRTGTARPCGGAPARRPEVGFALRRGADAVPVDGALIGGWTFHERARPLLGYAERGDLQALPGGLLANLGPVPAGTPPRPAPGERPAPKATKTKESEK